MKSLALGAQPVATNAKRTHGPFGLGVTIRFLRSGLVSTLHGGLRRTQSQGDPRSCCRTRILSRTPGDRPADDSSWRGFQSYNAVGRRDAQESVQRHCRRAVAPIHRDAETSSYTHSDFDIRASFGFGYFVIRHSAVPGFTPHRLPHPPPPLPPQCRTPGIPQSLPGPRAERPRPS